MHFMRPILLLVFCCVASLYGGKSVTLELPEWYSEANNLLVSLEQIEDTVMSNVTTLHHWETVLAESSAELSKYEQMRTEYIAAVALQVQELQNALEASQRINSEKDLAIAGLQQELHETRVAYDELVQLSGEKAVQLIDAIHRIKSGHDQLVMERDGLAQLLEQYLTSVQLYLDRDRQLFQATSAEVDTNEAVEN